MTKDFQEPQLPKPNQSRLENLWGLFKTSSAIPAYVPRNVIEQFVIYKNGSTKRLYVYDGSNNAWSYVALT